MSEFAKLRHDLSVYDFPRNTRTKITARYSVDVGNGQSLSCVRVRFGIGPVVHFSAERFAALFKVVSHD